MNCPCNSQKTYAKCCQPYLENNEIAPTAEALMRSRYTAFTKQNIDYLLDTHDPETNGNLDKKAITEWAEESEWQGLEIIEATEDTVEFKAHFSDHNGEKQVHHEHSRFRQVEDRFYYSDGKTVIAQAVSEKIGRNDPCICGSGKKYKKCCG